MLICLYLLDRVYYVQSFHHFAVDGVLVVKEGHAADRLVGLAQFGRHLRLVFTLFGLQFGLADQGVAEHGELFFVAAAIEFHDLGLVLCLEAVEDGLFQAPFHLLFHLAEFGFRIFLACDDIEL